MPTTKSGRVKKNRIALKAPDREKRVAVKRVDWYGVRCPKKNHQRTIL